jgi:DNA-binding NarL/FixJ family response regulator
VPRLEGAEASGADRAARDPRERQARARPGQPAAVANGAAVHATGRRVIRVVLCDDHAVVRAGLQRLLDSIEGIQLLATTADGQEAVEVVTRLRPDVVLMDLSMPRLDGVAATRQIATAAPQARVVVLTSFHHRARIAGAIEAGARGYVLKDATPAELVDAIRSAAGMAPPHLSQLSAKGLGVRLSAYALKASPDRPMTTPCAHCHSRPSSSA